MSTSPSAELSGVAPSVVEPGTRPRAGNRVGSNGGELSGVARWVSSYLPAVTRAPDPREEELGPFRAAIAAIGAAFIHALIRVLGRVVRTDDVPWLVGPMGGDYIGDAPYEECAEKEGLTVERHAQRGGLIPRFQVLARDGFDPSAVRPEIRRFYENTAEYRIDVWAETYFPASIGLWLLVTTISRAVNQLNFPLRMLDTAKGMDSEIVLLRTPDGEVRYAGWYRRLLDTGRAIYTGFYMTTEVSTGDPCIKTVFPMPNGNATVILRPFVGDDGSFELRSWGQGFGDAGFYRVLGAGEGKLRVWLIRTLKEHFRVYVDDAGTLRCDHRVRFLGLPVLHLHYKIAAPS